MKLRSVDMASLLGVTPRRLNQMVGEEIAVRLSPGMFDAIATNQNYIASLTVRAETKAAALDLTAEKARLTKEQADHHGYRNSILRRDLIPAEEVEREWSDMVRKIRSGVLSLTSRIRSQIGILDATHAEIINREITIVLEELADDDPHSNDPEAGR